MSSQVWWFATRSTGIAALVLLTASMVLGILTSSRYARPNLPRFVTMGLHRNVSLLVLAFLTMHIVTTVVDSFAPVSWTDALLPFAGTYRPFWLGLGTVAFDLLLALIITSLLRERIGYPIWRAVHWAAYAAWPVALMHGLGTGSDTKVRWAVFVNVGCLVAVMAAVLVRVGWTKTVSGGRRAIAALATVAVAVGVYAWMVLEPMRPGWARRSGTPNSLLAASERAPKHRSGSDGG